MGLIKELEKDIEEFEILKVGLNLYPNNEYENIKG